MKKRIMEDEALIAKLRRDREEGKITWKTTGVYVEYAPMLKGEFVNIRKSLNLTQYKLSQVISTTSRAIQSYEQGIASVPGSVARMMRLMKENALYRAIMLHDIMSFKKDNPDIKAITKEFNNILKTPTPQPFLTFLFVYCLLGYSPFLKSTAPGFRP